MQTFLTPREFMDSFTPPLARDLTYRLLKEKRIKHIRVNRKILIPKNELSEWVDREVAEAQE